MKSTFAVLAVGLIAIMFVSPLFLATPLVTVSAGTNEPVASTVSHNWAGYVVNDSSGITCTGHANHGKCSINPQPDVTAAYGSWIVQDVSGSSANTYSTQFVGIGGWFDSTLVQTGTESDVNSSGNAVYYAWYELLPAFEVVISNVQVSAGDKINASVVCISACSSSTQNWNITLVDTTTGVSNTTITSYSSSLLSAEWIDERTTLCLVGPGPHARCSLSTLADFGTASFGSYYTNLAGGTDKANINGTIYPIGSTLIGHAQVNMVTCPHGPNSCTNLATTSSLTGEGTSFTVTTG